MKRHPMTMTKSLHEWRLIVLALQANHTIRNEDGSYPFDNPEPPFTCDAIAGVIDLYALYVEDDDREFMVSITVPQYAKALINSLYVAGYVGMEVEA